MLAEIDDQARHLAEARIAPAAHTQIAAELADARCLVDAAGDPPVTLISFDAHPGNFLIARTGRAVLVDLEKARYSLPGFDLAHATIYTSTTWDVATHAVLDVPTVARAYRAWLTAMPAGAAEAHRPWLLPARRLMWLWAVTWCAKWRVLSGAAACRPLDPDASAEDWSEDKSEAALIAHVRDRVDHYLEPSVIARVRRDWAAGSALHRLATITRQE
jgi:thiamine kinase-like enzyme